MKEKKSDKLRVVFFGLGSIGKKHANIIKNNFDFDLYAYRTNKGQEKNDLRIKELNVLEEVFSVKPNIAFITNPTFLHTETALECANKNISLFIEKPLSNSLKDLDKLERVIKKRNIFTYIAYNMRFHPVITNIKSMVREKEKPIYFRVVCSSYLPEWRPNQDYSSSYSARSDLGGGVLLDLSHEIDYITLLFGEIKGMEGYCEKISNLDISSEDILDVQIKCSSEIIGNLHLDCFSRNNERKIQIYYNNEYLEGDLLKSSIKIINKNGNEKTINYRYNIEDTYKKQIEYFFKQYYNKNQNIMNNFSDALKTFKKIMNFKKKYCQV